MRESEGDRHRFANCQLRQEALKGMAVHSLCYDGNDEGRTS
jgi:hypothetical protein